jgi:Uncharacterized homolog of phage Mu protein gp47
MYTPQTIAEIKAEIISDLEGETGQTTPIFKRAFNRVLATALAGVVALLHRRILWGYRQIFTDTCDEEALAYKEARYGITPSPSVAAILVATISGDEGATSPAGTLWTCADNGLAYLQSFDATISGGIASAQVECLTLGALSTLATGAALSLVSPLAGITGAVVASSSLDGQDADTLEERRAQVRAREQRTDEIGTVGYYISKALEVSGVAFARVSRNAGGDVDVYPLAALSGPARVPGSTLLATIQAYLQDLSRRPLCANIYALASVERTASVVITGLSPSDATTKANITAAINAYLYARLPRQYTDDPESTDWISVGDLWAIISANGAVATGVTLTVSGIGSGVMSYQLPIGEIVAPGGVSFA